MRSVFSSVACLGMMFAGTGCVLQLPVARPAAQAAVVEPAPAEVVQAEPVLTAPGVIVFTEVPAVADRVYIYEPGYYPGTYFYNDGYVYNGYWYPRDVYVNRVVTENIHENRYMDVRQNRVASAKVQKVDAANVAKSGGGTNNARTASSKTPANSAVAGAAKSAPAKTAPAPQPHPAAQAAAKRK